MQETLEEREQKIAAAQKDLEKREKKLQNLKFKLKRLYGQKYIDTDEELEKSNNYDKKRLIGKIQNIFVLGQNISLSLTYKNKNNKDIPIVIYVQYHQRRFLYDTFNFNFIGLKEGRYNFVKPVEIQFEYKTQTDIYQEMVTNKIKRRTLYFLHFIEKTPNTPRINKNSFVEEIKGREKVS